jgi:L-iditol 2-dehydrogenase
MTNRSAVLHAAATLSIEDRPVPDPGPGQVLVEVQAVGICGSDVHYYQHGRIGSYVVHQPMIIGHEAAGTVVDVGAGVDPSVLGQHVALEPGVPCKSCAECLHGRYNLCPEVVFFATPPVDGAICQFVAIDAAFAHAVPAGLSHEQAAMAEPVSVGVWAARKAQISPGDRVLVTGAGPIGLLAAQVARAFGASSVTVTDLNQFRLDAAQQLGLDAQLANEPLTRDYDVLLECSGSQAALSTGMQALARAGRVVLVGMGADTVAINVPLIQGHEITITGTFRYANTYPLALQLIASGAVNVDKVITHRFGIEDSEAALTLSHTEPESLKAIVLPQA